VSTQHDFKFKNEYLNHCIEIVNGYTETSLLSISQKTRSDSVNFLEQTRQSSALANENQGNFLRS